MGSEKGSETTWINLIFDRGMEHPHINNVVHIKENFLKISFDGSSIVS